MPSNLNLDYYYGTEADQYSFYRIPKTLLTDPRYKSVSIEAIGALVNANFHRHLSLSRRLFFF